MNTSWTIKKIISSLYGEGKRRNIGVNKKNEFADVLLNYSHSSAEGIERGEMYARRLVLILTRIFAWSVVVSDYLYVCLSRFFILFSFFFFFFSFKHRSTILSLNVLSYISFCFSLRIYASDLFRVCGEGRSMSIWQGFSCLSSCLKLFSFGPHYVFHDGWYFLVLFFCT